MSIAKAVISGTVYRNPEKRFTGNNIPVTTFTLNIDEKEQSLVRIVARGNNAETIEQSVSKGDKIVVEGRLQTATVKMDDGSEKRIYEIDANTIEKLGEGSYAEVYKAYKKVDGIPIYCAVKHISLSKVKDAATIIESLKKEATIMQKLNGNKHIINYLNF